MTAPHPTDLLHDAVDGRLDESQQATLDAHLSQCEQCRREVEALRWTKSQAAGARALAVPPTLVRDLREALDREGGAPRGLHLSARHVMPWLVAAAAVALLIWFGTGSEPPHPPARAAADYRAIVSGTLPLVIESRDPSALEGAFRAVRPEIPPRVFDFGMMGFTLLGGRPHQFGNDPAILFAYRDAAGRIVVCQMYRGEATSLPPPQERRTNREIEFLIYREGDVTLVFWQEGQILCVLAADGDAESAVQLAFAKAIKV